ncbi:phage coat protein [Thauera aromatica]|uniref:major capsid protein n=1 Tax=Thauera aromatica TaxID=59405 RepID=UPI001FFC33BA|nr:major capsid protein [Thauera aromatica]MCK2088654.1 phage coat protein [Thauera aromatica]
MKKLQTLGAGLGLAVLSSASFAAAPDVAAVVTEIEGAATPIAAIGAAVLLVMVGIKVFKWVRRAM